MLILTSLAIIYLFNKIIRFLSIILDSTSIMFLEKLFNILVKF